MGLSNSYERSTALHQVDLIGADDLLAVGRLQNSENCIIETNKT